MFFAISSLFFFLKMRDLAFKKKEYEKIIKLGMNLANYNE